MTKKKTVMTGGEGAGQPPNLIMKYLAKTIESGLYFLVFILPLQTRWIISQGRLNNGPWEYGTYSLYGTDILLIILLALFVIYRACCRPGLDLAIARRDLAKPRQSRSKWQEHYDKNVCLESASVYSSPGSRAKPGMTDLFIAGLFLVSAMSVLFAADKLLALYKLGWLALGIGLFYLIAQADYSKTKLIWSLLTGTAVQAGLGIWQFLSQAAFQSKWLGLAAHQASELGTSVVEIIGRDGLGERWLRAYGGLDHPNILGGLLAIVILLLIGEIIWSDKFLSNNPPNPPFKGGLKGVKFFLRGWPSWLLLIVFTAALFFSFSRSAWLGLGVGLASRLIWTAVKKNLPAQQSLLQVILIIGLTSFILFLTQPNLAMTRLYYAPTRLENKSAGERIESIKNAWPIIKSYWAGGAGIGNYTLALRHELKTREQSYLYQPAHNVFLLVWSEAGIFGLAFFGGMIMYLIILNSRWRVDDNSYYPKINLAVLAALIIIMSLDHWLWSLHFGVLFLWLALGLVMRPEDKN